jgi:hypothetical protein
MNNLRLETRPSRHKWTMEEVRGGLGSEFVDVV